MPQPNRIDHCRAAECRRPIRWILLESGKRMPIDLEPSEAGTVFVPEDGSGAYVLDALAALARRQAGDDLYTSHFATCPAAGEFRGKKR